MMESDRYREAICHFDAVNCKDPNHEIFEEKTLPKELLYARRMTNWMTRVAPDASEALFLAARSQHIGRWKKPRSDYPMDRKGYLKWRTMLYRYHAETAGEILQALGYDEETINRVKGFLLKKNLKSDPEMQLLEDIVCIVFLESYFLNFSKKHDEEKIIKIVQKTWGKMTSRGHDLLFALELSPEISVLIQKALKQ